MYMTFQYLTVSCVGHVYDISIPEKFYVYLLQAMYYDISIYIRQFHVYLL